MDLVVVIEVLVVDVLIFVKGMILVEIDVLKVIINLVGGDIVYVGFKDYLVLLEWLDVFFILLDLIFVYIYIV